MFQPARRVVFAALAALAMVIAPMMNGLAQAQVPYAQLQAAMRPNPADQPKYAAVVVDANTGEVLYAKRADSQRYPASITKVMTLYLAFEALSEGRMKPTDLITVSAKAAKQPPTKLGMTAGDVITVDDAMKAIAVKSANDMAVALAEHMAGGSEEKFAALMTLRAQELGMLNTRFVNASGLPDSRQVSTARDIAILSRAVMRDYPQYYSLFNLRTFTYRGVSMNNHNRLLFRMDGVDGLKTGYTNASGYNLAASGVQDGRRLIVVMLGGTSNAARDNHVQYLLNTGWDVLRRRQQGEPILVAQSMFEPPEPDATQYASLEQGDAELPQASFVNGPGPSASTFKVASAMAPVADPPARTKPTPARKPAPKKPKGEWTAQVGAFKSKDQAKTQLVTIRKRFGQVLDDAEGVIGDRVGGFFRVQFTGLTADGARAACKALSAKRQTCMVVAPGR
ncbi:MAG: D-alanyl-D-alanine carboxypeptidase [Caulobacter sp.]|nr:D-alanyl-D-alanine carboxypeptidase [Caulobacter sp.]